MFIIRRLMKLIKCKIYNYEIVFFFFFFLYQFKDILKETEKTIIALDRYFSISHLARFLFNLFLK